MIVCGVICELNPFHTGHEYLFRMARSLTGADYVVAVMSGDFVQRGTPAICDKYMRTSMALKGGADLVIELPVMYATSSADYFAYAGVSLLDSLGCVDFLCFGSECGDIEILKNCAGQGGDYNPGIHILSQGADSSNSVNIKINKLLKEGMSYAKAYSTVTNNELASNDLLAIRYLKSLDMRTSKIKPVAVKRLAKDYLDAGDNSRSASAIRRRIESKEDYAHLVPKYSYKELEKSRGVTFPICLNDFGPQLYSVMDTVLENEKHGELSLMDYMDVSANIEGRIKGSFNDFTLYEEFVGLVHSKEYTKSRIYRALLHVLLDIRKEDYPDELAECEPGYARILGFREGSGPVLSMIKESSLIPVISKAGDGEKYLDEEALNSFLKDVHAANVYDKACVFKFGKSPIHDFSRQIVIV